MVILCVTLKVSRQRVDPLRQNGYLNFRRASIVVVGLKRADNLGLALFRQHDLCFSF